jgi:hypothetical protein
MMDLERERTGLDDVSKKMSKTEGPKNASFVFAIRISHQVSGNVMCCGGI